MTKEILTIENFKADIDPNFALVIDQLDHALMKNGCTIALKPAKNGHVVSYIDKDSGKTLANFVSRKKGPQVRIYANNIADYMQILDGFPTSMKKQIEKAGVCKRLLDPTACNSRCSMGYVFKMDGAEYKKCRNNSFMFEISGESLPFIETFLNKELTARAV